MFPAYRSVPPVWLLIVAVGAMLTGCAAGLRVYDEPKAKLTATARENYTKANVLDAIEVEKKNLQALLAEELRIVRDNSQLQIDLALLSFADDDTPMADTYNGEVTDRIQELGYLDRVGLLRASLVSEEGARLRNRELDDRARRITRLSGRSPPACRTGAVLPNVDDMDWPTGLDEDKLSMARSNYKAYRKVCGKLNEEWQALLPLSGKTAQAWTAWQDARAELDLRAERVQRLADEVTRLRADYEQALDKLNAAKGSGEKLEQELKAAASAALEKLDEAKGVLNALDSGVLARENVGHIITLLTAVAGGEAKAENADVKKAVVVLKQVLSLAGDMKALIEQAKAPPVSNLLIEMQHQVLRMEYAQRLETLAKERVDILRRKYDAYRSEARHWLAFMDAVCSSAVLSAGKEFPGQSCDDFSVHEDTRTCKIEGDPEINDCVLAKPWNKNIRSQANPAATRELYKALAAYVQALAIESTQRKQAFRLVDVKHRETLAAKESALRSWNNLVETPIAQLDGYFQAGIKADEVADVLVKALGFTAITAGIMSK